MNEFPATERHEKIVRREGLLAMLRAALETGELRFARQAALSWLAAYPGDLEVSLLHAQVMLMEGRAAQAVSTLELLARKDPFNRAPYRLLAQAIDNPRRSFAQTSLYALTGSASTGAQPEPWGEPLREVISALGLRQFAQAESVLPQVVQIEPDLLLGACAHLLIDRAMKDIQAVDHLAQQYHERWPDCILFRMVMAETQLELGNEPEAVRLLHLCVAQDSTGIIARRLWGSNHAYRSLWPDEMVIHFTIPIPAGVAVSMGWNRLEAGRGPSANSAPAEPAAERPAEAKPAEAGPSAVVNQALRGGPVKDPLPQLAPIPLPGASASQPEDAGLAPWMDEPASDPAQPGDQASADESVRAEAVPDESSISEEPAVPLPPGPSPIEEGQAPEAPAKPHQAADPIAAVGRELEALAKKVKQPGLAHADGRFPIYVIFSSKEGLIRQYGPRTWEVLDGELRRLAGLIRQQKGWGAAVFYPDDAACASQIGLLPMQSNDPWKLKHALAELDEALGKRGERIGALLIVGGDMVVPFHRLPNPTDDGDSDVPSDSPYATLDANYFVPEWPVGRLPGEKGPDAGLLLEQIHNLQRFHGKRSKAGVMFGFNLSALFQHLLEPLLPKKPQQSFGYTAAVWRRSSLAVFRPIGAPHTVLASPPSHSGSFDKGQIASAPLAYYNLHGLEDGPCWYGQRDPLEPAGADYPVALAPEDLHRSGRTPRIVFSEACYGGNVLDKCENDSLALKFLALGSLGVVASTCIAYGAVNTPLVAADFLGSRFWKHLKAGCPAGEALSQAKIDLVREMERRQGFLDGEDQKTLISFVLYGDPLADYDGFRTSVKASPRVKNHPAVKTVCDLTGDENGPVSVPPEVLKQVKGLLTEYLPGADLAELHFSRQHAGCDGKHHHCPTSDLNSGQKRPARRGGNGSAATDGGRLVVTASKQVRVAQHLHRHYLRVTLDEAGKPVKVSISR